MSQTHNLPPVNREQLPAVAIERTLAAGSGDYFGFEPARFDSENSIYEGIDMEKNPLVAEIDVVDNHFAIMENPEAETLADRFFLVTTRMNMYAQRDDGKRHYVVAKSFSITPGVSFALGRAPLKEAGDLTVSNFMSRQQATIILDDSGRFTIVQDSNNVDTKVTFGKKTDPAKAWEVDETSPSEVHEVAEVPQTEEDKLEARIKEIEQQIDELKAPFDEDVQMDLWRYASGRILKRDAQVRGDGNASIAYEQQAGQAYRTLPAAAKDIAEKYRYAMDQLESLREKSSTRR